MKIESPPELPKANLPPQAQEKPVIAPPPATKIESPPELPKASPPPQAREKPVLAPPPVMKIELPPELPKAKSAAAGAGKACYCAAARDENRIAA